MAASTTGDQRPIDRRIAEAADTLTGSERRLAKVVLETQGNLAGFTAVELAARAQVSNATAARFFQRLGYPTYNAARRQARDALAWGSPLHELDGAAGRRDANTFAQHVAQDLHNLSRTAANLPDEVLRMAVDILVAATTIWVAGFRNSMALASYARGLLVHVKPDVRLLPVAGMTVAEDVVGFGPRQALLVVGFRRRPPALREIMAEAQRAGMPSVLIADDSAARTAQLATVVLRCQSRGHGMFDSYAAPMTVINYIVNAVGLASGLPAVNRLCEIEALHGRLRSFDADA